MARGVIIARLGLAALALVGACEKKKPASAPPPIPVAALRAIPADAIVVVGLDVPRLAASRLVGRAVDKMLERDAELGDKLRALAAACQIDLVTQVKSVHLALGPPDATGKRPSLQVATGQLAEANLTRCLQAGVGSGGGDVTVRQTGGHTLYRLVSGRHELFFAFGHDDTVLLGSEPWVVAGLGDGPKVESSPALADALARVDRKAAMWAVATVDPELGAALVRNSKGEITQGPTVVSGSLDPLDGVRADARVTMRSAADAKALASYARGELAMGTIAAQALGLGPALAKATVEQDGTAVRLRIALTDAEVKDVLSAIDRGLPARQDAQPAADAGVDGPSTATSPVNPPATMMIDAGSAR